MVDEDIDRAAIWKIVLYKQSETKEEEEEETEECQEEENDEVKEER